eukprot:g1359.t1
MRNRGTLRIGVIVNDLATVNIDSQLVHRDADFRGGVYEVQGGCICCDAGEELFHTLKKLIDHAVAQGNPLDHILVECSGISQASEVVAKLSIAPQVGGSRCIQNMEGLRGSEKLKLLRTLHFQGVVAVIDASVFLHWCNDEKKNKLLNNRDGVLRVLVMEQVRDADSIVFNKVDLVDEEQLGLVEEKIKAINPTATTYRSEYGRLPIEAILNVQKKKTLVQKETPREIQCNHENCNHSSCSKRKAENDLNETSRKKTKYNDDTHYGVSSVVYKRQRPFHPTRLAMRVLSRMPASQQARFELAVRIGSGGCSFPCEASEKVNEKLPLLFTDELKNPFSGIFRSKGFIWLAHAPCRAFYWAHTGPHLEITSHASWWIDTPKASWPSENVDSINKLCKGDYGDRRQELVLMGTNLERAELEKALDECLLADEEMAAFELLLKEKCEEEKKTEKKRPLLY